MHENFMIAMGLSIFAGLSTGIGSAIAFFIKDRNTKVLTFAMGFAAGVMLYVSFMEIFPHALSELEGRQYIGLISFFVGMLLVGAIDKLIPHDENPHEFSSEHKPEEGEEEETVQKKRLMRVGLLTALALALHNFPEGMASFVAALEDVNLGITIAIAIAIHNIPEGIAVSMPIYYATGDRKKAFFYSFLSGVVEPIGAIVGYLILMPFIDPTIMAILLSGVSGIMVFISLDQLLPAAEEYGEHHLSIYGVMIGMGVMAVSLMLL